MINLSIVILNYNSKDFTLSCVNSIKENYKNQIKSKEFEIFVVDNASSDGSKEMFEKIDEIEFIYNKENFGFSKGNNQAIPKTKGRYVLFLNPDTVVYKDTLTKMIDFMDNHKDAGAATCRVVMENGRDDDASHRGFPTPWNSFTFFTNLYKLFPKSKLFNGYQMGWLDFNYTHEIDALAGAFMMVRREAGEEVGWWDEDYFFYGEDLDFCYMLKQKKWKIYFVADVKVFHHKGVSGGIRKESQTITTADSETRIRATNWRYKAMLLFYDKHYKDKYPFFVEWLVKKAVNLKLKKSLNAINKS